MMAQIIDNPFPMWNMISDLIMTFPDGDKALKMAGLGKTAKTLGLIEDEEETNNK